MDINEKVQILGAAQLKTNERLVNVDDKLDKILGFLSSQQQSPETKPDVIKEEPIVRSTISGYNVVGTLINQDDGKEYVVVDPRNKRGPFDSYQDALEFGLQNFGPTEKRDFFITEIRGL